MNNREYEFRKYISEVEVIEFTNGKSIEIAYKTDIAAAFERYG